MLRSTSSGPVPQAVTVTQPPFLAWLRDRRWRDSLLVRVVLGIVVVALLVSIPLFVGIDHLVTRQFEAVHAERVQRAAHQVKIGVENEMLRLGELAGLLAADTDLNNSAYYHLYLEGELDHPQAAVERIAQAFRLVSVSLYQADGIPVTHHGDYPAPLLLSTDETQLTRSGVYQQGDRLWLVAQVGLVYNSNLLAWLVIADPLDRLLRGLEETYLASIRVIEANEPPASVNSGVFSLAIEPTRHLQLLVEIPDTVGHAIAAVKRLLSILLPFAVLLLAIALALLLHWQLRPVTALSASIAAVGRGEFGHHLPIPNSGGELRNLIHAFNTMSADLAQLREVERRLHHQEQLSAIGRVAARVAHDINNPLTVISSAATMLHRRLPSGSSEAEDAGLIRHHTERCIRTVEALLQYGRPVKPRTQNLDPTSLLQDILRRRNSQAGMAGRFALHGKEQPLPPIEADPLLFEQMLDNLLNNAVEAAPDGTVILTLSQGERQLVLDVSDTGPGFSNETQAHLFEPFFTTKSGGTGLGLASCLAIARAHGGDIEVLQGEGGRVRVYWPLTRRGNENDADRSRSPRG
ncbi:MAG: HAMP domain-containing histidine kinase [Gammaproteobacteria bacterium]|nr:HAMP domain-containing histidine kinase [Gammaproteobacteria bacterium]